MAGRVNVEVGFTVNKAGLNDLVSSLQKIQQDMQKAGSSGTLTKELQNAGAAAKELESILNSSWNSKLGQLDLSKFNASVKTSYGSISNLKHQLEAIGPTGVTAYNKIASSVLNTNVQLKQSNKLLDSMATSMANTVKWGITSSIFNKITSSIQQAFHYATKLDSALNDIRIVTDKSAESMEKFAQQANTAAKNLGASTLDYTEASLIYYQQGLSDEETKARAETTIKAANVTGQSGQAVSEQLTSVWNGYKVTAEETELYIDKLAAVAATTAADLEELSTGMSKVASAANAMGVDFDDLNAQIATIVSVTRQAPESVGTALKTIYARLGDLKVDGVDEFGVKLGEVSSQLQTMGVDILDVNGEMRDMTSVMTEVAEKWDTWTRSQQQAAAIAMAGKRQYNNLVALFENWDMYSDALETSAEAAGTLQHQQDIYMESTEAHLQKLSTEAENTYDILFDQDTVNGFADALRGLLSIFNNFLAGVGGGGAAFLVLGNIIANVFNNQIGRAIATQVNNSEIVKQNIRDLEAQLEFLETGKSTEGLGGAQTAAIETEINMTKDLIAARKGLTEEQYQELNNLRQIIAEEEERLAIIEDFGNSSTQSAAKREATLKIETEELKEQESLLHNIISHHKMIIQSEADSETELNGEIGLINDLTDMIAQRAAINGNEILTEQEINRLKEYRNSLQKNEVLGNEEILDITNMQEKVYQAQNEYVKEINANLELQRQYEEGIGQARARNEQRKGDFQSGVNQGQRTSDYSDMVRGLTSLVTVTTTIIGLFDTLSDKSITTGQKLKRVFSTLAIMAPMLMRSVDGIRLGMISLGKTIGITTLTAETGFLAATKSVLAFETALGPLGWVLLAITAVVAGLAAAIGYANEVEEEHQRRLQQEQEELDRLEEKYKDLDTTLEDFKSSVSDYSDAISALQDLEEATDEYGQKLEEVNQKAKDLIETYGLWNDYVVKNGVITIDEEVLKNEEAKQKSNALSAKSDYYLEKINVATSQYNEYLAGVEKQVGIVIDEFAEQERREVEPFRELSEEQLLQVGAALQELKDNAKEINKQNVAEKIQNIDSWLVGPANLQHVIDNADVFLDLYNKNKDIEDSKLQYAKEIASIDIEQRYLDQIRQAATNKETGQVNEEYADRIAMAISSVAGDEIANKLSSIDVSGVTSTSELNKQYGYDIGNDDDLAFTYAEKILGLDRKNLRYDDGEGINVGTITTTTGETVFENFSDDVMRQELAMFAAREKILQEYADTGKSEKILNSFTQLLNKTDEIGSEYGANFSSAVLDAITNNQQNFDFSSVLKNLSPEDVESLRYQSSDILNFLGLTESDIQNLGFQTAEQFRAAWVGALSKYKITDWLDQQAAELSAKITDIKDITTSLLDGKELSEDQQMALQALENEYGELATIQDKTSMAYINKLLEIREALEKEEIAVKKLKEETLVDEAIEINVESNGGEDKLQEKLKDICEADYSVLVEIKSDIQDDFDTAVSSMDDLSNMASKIGEDFIVAAEDIEEINSVFPGILANMELVGDGTVKLNSEIVSSAMESAQAEAAADTDATIQKLQNQADELAAKRDAAKKIANIAQSLVGVAEISSEQQGNINEALEQLKSDNSTETSDQQKDDQVAVAETAASSATSMANSFGNAYQTMAQDAAEWARIAHTALQSATDINVEPPDAGSFGGASFSTTANVTKATSNKADLNSFSDYNQVDNWQEIADYYNSLAESYDEAYNSVIGKIGELSARGQKVGETLKNIASGSGASGKKGGGGGGGSKDKELKNLEDEFDRYWELKKAIDATDRSLKYLEKDKKNLYGYQLIDALKYENQLLEQQKGHYEQLLAAQEQEAAELRAQLGTMGVMFDASGAIVNYAEATAKALAAYNAAIQQYNAGLIDETTLGIAENAFNNFKELLSRYDTLYYKEMQDTMDKLDDIRREELANNLKAWEVEVQLKLDLKELKRGWNDFLTEIQKDFQKVYDDLTVEAKRMVDDAKTYIGSDGSIATIINAIHDVTHEIDVMNGGGESSMFESISQAQEKLKELNDQLQDAARGLHDLWEEAWDNYLNGIDQVADKLDDLMDQFEKINDELEFQRELIELIYGEDAYELMDTLFKGQEKSTSNQIQSLKTQADMWHQLWLETGATMENQENWNEDQRKYYDEWMEAQSDLNDLVIDYIKLLKDDYINAVKKAIKELDNAITGSSLERVQTQWERISAYADKYLDDVEKAYNIQKFANEIDESIAKLDNLKQQQKLQALREKEINYLREKEHLTQYDLDAAEARYQIALKEMALEDAQNNKTSMKLVRNEQGNWAYQYMADADDVASKRQELLDAFNELYQLASDAYEANIEAALEVQQHYEEQLEELNIRINDGDAQALEERAELEAWYEEQRTLLIEENQLYRNDLRTAGAAILLEVYEQDAEAYGAMTETEQELVDNLTANTIEDYMQLEVAVSENIGNIGTLSAETMAEIRRDWGSTAQALIDFWNKDEGGSVRYEIQVAYQKMEEANNHYRTEIDNLAKTVERDFGPEGIKGAIEKAANATDSLNSKTQQLVNDGVAYLAVLKQAVDMIAAAWQSVQQEIINAIGLLEQYINMIAGYNAAVQEHNAQVAAAQQAAQAAAMGAGTDGKKGPTETTPTSTKPVNYWTQSDYEYAKYQSQQKKEGNGYLSQADWLNEYRNGDSTTFKGMTSSQTNAETLARLYHKSVHMATGGYTGSWNNGSTDGRLAVLHQKELVLNEDDTSNFLQGINTIRDLSSLNGSVSGAIMSSIAGMVASMISPKAGVGSSTVNNNEDNSSGNVFNITAEFPNANDVNEIREAIMSLPNLASQYIARNLK